MKQILLDNLARNQAFDTLLRSGNTIDALAAQYLDAVMFQPVQAKREIQLDKLQTKIVDYFKKSVLPEAGDIGNKNARLILAKLSPGTLPDLNDPAMRRKILFDGKLAARDRVKIVQSIVADKANTLDNRLTAYWLEPGQDTKAKLARLKEIHAEQAKSLKAYEAKVVQYDQGLRESRPSRPRLDYMAKFQAEVKQGVREQARRAGTDAETAAFGAAGFERLMWCTVNAGEACPDCRGRAGRVGDAAYWNREGRPGSGRTVCGTACFCMLIPEPVKMQVPGLEDGLEVPKAN